MTDVILVCNDGRLCRAWVIAHSTFEIKPEISWLSPKPAKTTPPISTHQNIEPIGKGKQLPLNLPVPEKAKKPVMKRVDALRLGGRIGRKIKQIFNQTKVQIAHSDKRRSEDDPITAAITSEAFGEVTHATKSILAGSRRSNHRTTDRSGYQSTSTDQRCRGLGQVRKAWRGYLGLGQAKFQQPLAGIYQRIRGFSSKLNPWRNNTQLSTVNIFEFFGIGQGSSPPDNKDKFSRETNPFHFGGINMNLTNKKSAALGVGLVMFVAILCWGLVNDNWTQAPESIRPFSTYDWSAEFSDIEMKLDMATYFSFFEIAISAGLIGWLSYYSVSLVSDLITPTKDEAT